MKRRAFASALAVSCFAGLRSVAPASSRNGRWAEAAPMPGPRQAFAIAAVDSRIFVFGGYSARGMRLNEMYDIVHDRWLTRAPLPAAVNYPAAASVDGKIYVFGGFAESFGIVPGRAVGDGYRYDPQTDAWTEIAKMPTWRAGFALVERGGALYAIGGRAKLDVNANERYNPADDSWETLAPLPEPRDQLAAVTLRGEIHVTGGRAFELGANSARHDVYDVAQDAWRGALPLPKTRSGHAAAVLDGRILLAGGESNGGVDDDLVAFDPDRKIWESLATMPHPRHGLGAVAVNARLYTIGGSAGFGLSAPSDLNETFVF